MNSTSRSAEVGEDRRQIARLLEHRARRRADRHAQLVADHVGERRLAEPGRAVAAARDRAPRRAACAAAIDTCRFSRTRSWPMYSSSVRGRSPASYCASSSTRAAVTRRSSVMLPRRSSRSACFSVRSKSPSGVRLDRRRRPLSRQAADDTPGSSAPRAHRRAAAAPRGAGAGGRRPPAAARGSRSFSSSTMRSDGLLADAGNRGQPRDVAALDRANRARAARCPTAPPAPASGRCR